MGNKKFKLLILAVFCVFFLTGCRRDDMDGIEISVTNYPNEYIVDQLYGDHSSIESVYPDGIDTNTFKVSKRQKDKYSQSGLFIYNGLIKKERSLAVDLLDKNQNLKIIDSAYVLETEYSPNELWLNPSSMLMMAQNIRTGLKEYITSTYLQKDIDKKYNNLKIRLSELDADYRIAVENTDDKNLLVADDDLKYLEKFGLNIICINKDIDDKTYSNAEELIKNGSISYIYLFKGDKLNSKAKKLTSDYPDLKTSELHKIDNLSDSDRENKKDYISLMESNLGLLKQEFHQ